MGIKSLKCTIKDDRIKTLNIIHVQFLLILALCCGCSADVKDTQIETNQFTPENKKEDFRYLKKQNFPFETLSAKVSIGKAVKANEKVLLSYELNLVNGFEQTIHLSKIEVFGYDTEIPLGIFDSTYLNLHLLRPGIEDINSILDIQANGFGVANLWLQLDIDAIPTHIFHRLTYKQKQGTTDNKENSVDIAIVPFPEQTELNIGLPFRAGKWFYVANAHRDARLITEGQATFPQRYAIDWVALTQDAKLKTDTVDHITSFKTYGADILAVSDGKVVFIKDGIQDNVPFGDKFEVEITRETVGGNYVVLDIGNGIYAFYGHLIPGSLTVEEGDLVKEGDIIGKLGNSGRSFAPHLHFHLETKSKYPLGGEGVPYRLDVFNQLAAFQDEEIGAILLSPDRAIELNGQAIIRRNQLPVGNGILEFKDK